MIKNKKNDDNIENKEQKAEETVKDAASEAKKEKTAKKAPKKAEKQKQSDNEVANLDLTEKDIIGILTSDDWANTKETKISVLNAVEDELMDMLK